MSAMRECGLWLSIQKHPLPVPPQFRRPDSVCACVMRGRDYYRVAMFRPAHTDGCTAVSLDDELVKDYCDAAWWTPGLEEAWVELDGMKEAFARASAPSVIPARSALGEAQRSRAKESATRASVERSGANKKS
jgi:hypothetical protein